VQGVGMMVSPLLRKGRREGREIVGVTPEEAGGSTWASAPCGSAQASRDARRRASASCA
jgi:hypothetical protein